MSPTASALLWTTEEVRVAGSSVRLPTTGSGAPLLVLHHDIGTPEQLPFYDALARHFTVLLPSYPGYDGSERPAWMRSVRDVAVTYQALLAATLSRQWRGGVMKNIEIDRSKRLRDQPATGHNRFRPDQSRAVSAPGRAPGPTARRRSGLSGGPGCPLHGAA